MLRFTFDYIPSQTHNFTQFFCLIPPLLCLLSSAPYLTFPHIFVSNHPSPIQGIVHRAIKPSNLMLHLLEDETSLKIANFSLAVCVGGKGGANIHTNQTDGHHGASLIIPSQTLIFLDYSVSNTHFNTFLSHTTSFMSFIRTKFTFPSHFCLKSSFHSTFTDAVITPTSHPFNTTSAHTVEFVAPEILSGSTYGKAVDMWSVGVVLFVLLGGYSPFYDDDEEVMKTRILRNDYQFDADCFAFVSEVHH